jgi:hypothetical protein
MWFQRGGFQQDNACFDASLECAHACRRVGWLGHTPALEIHLPGVKRADYGCSRNDTVRQRPAIVRTAIIHGQEAVAEIEDCDLLASDFHGAALA